MSNHDDEFKNVKKGLPSDNATQKASINFVLLFAIVGAVFGLAILLFQDTLFSEGKQLTQQGNYLPQQILLNSVLALLVGCVQAWIFKEKIKSRAHVFIFCSILSGLVAGFFGGLLMNAGIPPIIVGAISGAIAGGVSSWGQNSVMRNTKYKSTWLTYSIISWAIIYSIVWVIGWQPDKGLDMALAAIFLMIANGVGLAVFLNKTPQIEFS